MTFYVLVCRIVPGGFQLLQYVHTAAAAVHVYCAQENRVRLKWPTIVSFVSQESIIGNSVDYASICRTRTILTRRNRKRTS
jgi:hypothetical protein